MASYNGSARKGDPPGFILESRLRSSKESGLSTKPEECIRSRVLHLKASITAVRRFQGFDMTDAPILIRSVEVLSDDWAILKKYTFDYRRRDGGLERQVRQTYDRGHGAVILPYDPERGTVLLVRQFRLPAYVNGHAEPLIEACAGLLDRDDPETCIRREAEEELGYRLRSTEQAFHVFMSPGSVTERLMFFTGRYSPDDRIGQGGGDRHEGEDIEVLEINLDEAISMIDAGQIIDGKTIMLLQHIKLKGLMHA
jgi:nudix-type nucleoside diphosphatase (YffH/AdpP family)